MEKETKEKIIFGSVLVVIVVVVYFVAKTFVEILHFHHESS